jgi:hypothetical protein
LCASHCSAGVTRQATSSTGWCTTCSTIGESRGRWGDCHPNPDLQPFLTPHTPHPFALRLVFRPPQHFRWRGACVGPCPLPASCAWRCGGRARTTSPQASQRRILRVPHLPSATPAETACRRTLRTAAVIVVLVSVQVTAALPAAAKGAGALGQVVARAGPPDACLRWHMVHPGPVRTVCCCDDRPQPCTPCTVQGPRGTAAQVFC